MKKRLIFLGILLCTGLNAWCQMAYWQQEVQYTIDVALDDREHTLDGFLKLQYINHSPDTLRYIWFHCWPNAFKNDRTAFSDQLLINGRTDFYFSSREERGYMNRLDFREKNVTLKTEDHPQYIDVVKVQLATPLAPGAQTTLTTPFHVKLPKNFSRGGHVGKSYQITQWYPKPAVYDRQGWHPMPYLDQGEFYSEFGSYDVRITVPRSYVVAATGQLQNKEEKEWMRAHVAVDAPKPVKKKAFPAKPQPKTKSAGVAVSRSTRSATKPAGHGNTKTAAPTTKAAAPVAMIKPTPVPVAQEPTKTLQFKQDRVHDFAWFADKHFRIGYDTIQLPAGRVVEAWSFYTPSDSLWTKSISYLKDAVHFRSRLIGEYPYDVVSVVETQTGFDGGMEYPTITNIGKMDDAKTLDKVIEHEVGHNWFYGILASNERDHPWMDEGMNSYYGDRYVAMKYPKEDKNWLTDKLPDNQGKMILDAYAKEKKDQPINTPAAAFERTNYALVAYYKTALWMKELEEYLGQARFDSCMQQYYTQWQFRHPSPDAFRQVMEAHAGKDLEPYFRQLDSTGSLPGYTGRKCLKPAFLFSMKDYERTRYINFFPVIGYNMYDKFMVGLGIHNFSMPSHNFQYVAFPLYALGSKEVNGLGGVSYTWHPSRHFRAIELGLGGARFSTMEGSDSNGVKVFGGFYKVTPSLRFTFRNKSLLSTYEKWIEWKTYLIGERGFNYAVDSDDQLTYPYKGNMKTRYLNQLTFAITDYRKLYPYDVQLQLQQGDGFYRANATGHYYFNYAKGGGMQVRVFAAKFGYLGGNAGSRFGKTYYYQPKLTAVRGDEDYTYSNYFIGRSEFEGFGSRQIMVRDGGLKLRTDLFSGLQGRSDDWIASINFNTTLPEKLLPIKLPVRLFADVGTYADAWKKDAATSRFLYVAGVQVSLFKDLLNIYAPILYSKEFRDALKTVPEENKFGKRISFSIDIHRFNVRKITGY